MRSLMCMDMEYFWYHFDVHRYGILLISFILSFMVNFVHTWQAYALYHTVCSQFRDAGARNAVYSCSLLLIHAIQKCIWFKVHLTLRWSIQLMLCEYLFANDMYNNHNNVLAFFGSCTELWHLDINITVLQGPVIVHNSVEQQLWITKCT